MRQYNYKLKSNVPSVLIWNDSIILAWLGYVSELHMYTSIPVYTGVVTVQKLES